MCFKDKRLQLATILDQLKGEAFQPRYVQPIQQRGWLLACPGMHELGVLDYHAEN